MSRENFKENPDHGKLESNPGRNPNLTKDPGQKIIPKPSEQPKKESNKPGSGNN
jgi:hypothetical protein